MPDTPSPSRLPHPHLTATRATAWCLLLGLIWIWVTDFALWAMDLSTLTAALASASKGSLFLGLFGIPLYRLVRNHLIDDARRARLVEAIVDTAADPIFVLDGAGRFVFLNAALSQCLKRLPEQILGRTAREVCEPTIASRLSELLKADARVGNRAKELEFGGPDHQSYLVTVNSFDAIEETTGGCVVVCHDVTDRRRDQRTLTASEERYRAFADHAADAYFLQAEGGRIIDVNARSAESLGYTRDELIGATHELFTSLREAEVIPIAVTVMGGDMAEFEDIHRRKDGTTFPVVVRMKRIRVGDEWVVLSTARDITRQRKVEAARWQADAQRAAILQALPMHVALLDATGTITAVNEAWQRFALANAPSGDSFGIGINYQEVCDQAIGDCSVDAHQVAHGLRGVLDRTRAEFRLEYPCHSPNEQRWFEMVVTPVSSGGAVVMHLDVTARHRAAEVSRQQADGFRLLSKVATRLLAGGTWPDMIRDVCGRAAAYMQCDTYLSFRFNGTELVLDLAEGIDAPIREALARLPLGAELCGWCAQTHEPLYVPHLQASEDPRAAKIRAIGLRCYIAFPILADDRLLGTVSFASRSRDTFDDHEREFAQTVGHYLSTASERIRVQDELLESEERFRAVVDQAADPIFIFDGLKIIDVNQAACQSLGYDRKELLELEPADFDPVVSSARAKAMTTDAALGKSITFDTVHRRKDGSTFPVEVRCCPLVVAGRSLGLSMVRDLTERQRAESDLRASEEKYRRLVEVLPVSVHVIDGGQLVYCNPACMSLFGTNSVSDLLGKSPFELVHQDSHGRLADRLTAILKSDSPAPFVVVRVVRLDGTTRTVHAVATPIRGSHADSHLVCLTDVTEQERTAALLRSVLGSVGDAILTIDSAGTVQLANSATERLFGYASQELIGANVRTIMPEPHHGDHDRYLADYLRTGVAKVIGKSRDVVAQRKDGTVFPVELNVTELRLGEERHFTGVVRDVSAHKQLEEQFRQAQKMEAVGRLAGGVAHDFNNLLTVINGYADLILAELPSGNANRNSVAAIRDAGERAAGLTSQLLAFSRKTIVAPKVFDLRDVVAQAEKLLRRLIGEDITVTVVYHANPCRVNADPNQIDQAILNLAVNARDAMPTGGRLTLETGIVTMTGTEKWTGQVSGDYVVLTVSDTGCGMSEEVKAKIFEPFFTTKEVGKGTGLGLATVYGIVQQAGGHIEVTTEVGLGTTFRVYFPAVEVPVTETAMEAVPSDGRGAETILLVEDDDAVRTLCTLTLESQGYVVLAAQSGWKALDLLRANPSVARLMVTDVVMPEMSGRELADAATALTPTLQVLFISGYTDDGVFRHGVRDGIDAFLQKPFSPLGLARKVRELLDARR